MSPSIPRKRSRNLDDQAIEKIVGILDGWTAPKLTWDLFIQKIALRLRSSYTRQTLHNHVRIRQAFSDCKVRLSFKGGERSPADSPELEHALQRIARLEAENDRLRNDNFNLLEQFHRWVYNGYRRQMDGRMRDFMNQPLPSVHREPSEDS